jgi:hypothetical protein
MTTDDNLRLCGGSFFVLLLQAKKQRTSARAKTGGDTDGLSDTDILLGLIRVANPKHRAPSKDSKDSFRTKTSQYKSCRTSSGVYLPFTENQFIEKFDQRVKHQYPEVLSAMLSFISTFIDCGGKGVWLVAALLELIKLDNSIADDELFYIENGTQPLSKKDLLNLSEISLQSFLLGIWHYIIVTRPNNKIGRNTFEHWHKKSASERATRQFISNIGKNNEYAPHVNIPTTAAELPKTTYSKESPNDDEEYAVYLQNAYNKYSTMKTLLYSDQPRAFYDFYVCNDIYQTIRVSMHTSKKKIISHATTEILSTCSNFIIISGTGGLGKSMMMRHLLLDVISDYKDVKRIPIFLPLKDYNSSYSGLVNYIYEKFDSLGAGKDINEFVDILSAGKCLLLFDGLDEINTTCRKQFEHDLELFADKYSKNMFIISSRPFGSFLSFSRFTILNLSPFNKKQALELIDKLDFRTDEPAIKENFRTELDTKLYYTHRGFIENPLLLTIMLMTFEQFAEVPSKMHIFYKEAYVALSQKHDASKGAYKRTLHTELTADRFADYFAEFCARTYRDQKFEFTEIEFEKYFDQLIECKKDDYSVDASDFIYDLTANMCLMYYESQRYHFTHRSFQEYFCALYFSKQKDRTLAAIGAFFENKGGRNFGDSTFDMFYDMIPEKVEEYIFTPFLNNLFKQCDEEDNYWTFLKIIYPTIGYESGETNDSFLNGPASFIYNFIIQKENIHGYVDSKDFPFYDEFITTEYVYLDEDWHSPDGEDTNDLINKEEVSSNYILQYGEPETVGWNLEFDMETILDDPEKYKELIKVLNNDNFPLKQEYHDAHEYLENLKQNQKATGTDLFDLF